MNLTIKPGAAIDDAMQIKDIVEKIAKDMEKLDKDFRELLTEEIQTDWAETVLQNWTTYYKADIPEAMENMKHSASNLQTAVEEAIAFSQEAD